MQVQNHKLYFNTGNQVPNYFSPSKSNGRLSPTYIIYHATAGTSFKGAINTLTDIERKASAHIVIGRELGEVAQINSFTDVLWHAGPSTYENLTSLNRHSIGIEMVNVGPLTKRNNEFYSWTSKIIPSEQVQEVDGKYFQSYTPYQLVALENICILLKNEYPTIKNILGHNQICVPAGRKIDPYHDSVSKIKEIRKRVFSL